ncbi:acyltransferase [Chloroflexota bacterium]
MFSLRQILFHSAAELEVMFSDMGDPLRWRRRELRSFGVTFGSELWIGRHLFIRVPGKMVFGERLSFGHYTQLYAYTSIEIGDDFTSASNLTIYTGTHDPQTLVPRTEAVRIGDRVWCGANVTILPGVTVGNDVVIGASSLVNTNVPDNSVVAGVPARVMRALDRSRLDGLWTWAAEGRLPLTSGADKADGDQEPHAKT